MNYGAKFATARSNPPTVVSNSLGSLINAITNRIPAISERTCLMVKNAMRQWFISIISLCREKIK
jgi:hypothetical protein